VDEDSSSVRLRTPGGAFGDSGLAVSSGPLETPGHLIPTEESADTARIAELIGARAHQVFAGRLERASLTVAERATARAVHAPEGDCRDWDAVDAFAGDIGSQLIPVRQTR
jgi:menaquinone-dependent protoporphyrinogen oxidase